MNNLSLVASNSFHVDLFSCEPEPIKTEEKIQQFLRQLREVCGFEAYGEPIVLYFDRVEGTRGYTALQFFKNSFISAHFVSEGNVAHIDIFSVLPLPQKKICQFSQFFFRASQIQTYALSRQAQLD